MRRAARAVRGRADSGEALVEFALVLPILLVLSLGMLDFGRAFHTKSLLDEAAREGCRVAIVSKPPDPALIQDRVEKVLDSGGVKLDAITVSGPDASRMVEVKVEVTFTFLTPGVFSLIGASYGNTLAMVGRSTMRAEGGN